MSKQNFKSAAKRKRELAKLDKRVAKDQKRALKRVEQTDAPAVAPVVALAPSSRAQVVAPVTPTPLTLAQAVERWKNTKVVKPKRY
jgi:hypothetical protein